MKIHIPHPKAFLVFMALAAIVPDRSIISMTAFAFVIGFTDLLD